jgi:UDP-glucuronate 4-epimerase
MKILVTGNAGFIGHHLTQRLVKDGHTVQGWDSLVPYYDVNLKKNRLAQQQGVHTLTEPLSEDWRFSDNSCDYIVHLAAQPGVRYSIDHPLEYIKNNIQATTILLEQARRVRPIRTVIASSSSVYGGSTQYPWRENAPLPEPLSLYAATKQAVEQIAAYYRRAFDLDIVLLRYFTVYGPWNRPDMAIWKFTDAINRGRPITLYGTNQYRDFTYIDDIVEGTVQVMYTPALSQGIYNLGCGEPQSLGKFVSLLQEAIGKEAKIERAPMQPGDPVKTYADVGPAIWDLDWLPKTRLEDGVPKFVKWFLEYEDLYGRVAT